MGTMEDEEAIYDDASCIEMKQSVNTMRAMFEKSAAAAPKPKPLKPLPPKPKKPLLNQNQQNGEETAPQLPEKGLRSPVKKTPPPPVEIRKSTQCTLLEKRPSSRETIWPPANGTKSPSLSPSSPVDVSSPVDKKPPVLKPKPKVSVKPKPALDAPSPVDSKVQPIVINDEPEPESRDNSQPELLRSPKPKSEDDINNNNDKRVTEAKRITAILTGHNSIVPLATELEPRVQHGRKVYLLQPLPKKGAMPPKKPKKPDGIDLSIFEVDDDEELYDDIGTFADIGRHSAVSEIETFDSEVEEEEEIYDDVEDHRENTEDDDGEDDDIYEEM